MNPISHLNLEKFSLKLNTKNNIPSEKANPPATKNFGVFTGSVTPEVVKKIVTKVSPTDTNFAVVKSTLVLLTRTSYLWNSRIPAPPKGNRDSVLIFSVKGAN